ncbi:DUF1294 domain-containing protein [Litorisediminicola beolgyonensis]|uniref:DUF1294 domain-containing protein n=1 Tax=Litorisediminicola beolgyonensis TaxID=1173614 RepID=A0ABW3ZCU8_9RHOB
MIWLTLWCVAVNVAALGAFAVDKARAEESGPRIPESTLLLLAAAGGWPGAKIGQQACRHKTRKQPFRLWLDGIGLAWAAGLLALWLV